MNTKSNTKVKQILKEAHEANMKIIKRETHGNVGYEVMKRHNDKLGVKK